MQRRQLGICILFVNCLLVQAQTKTPVEQAVEGGKVLVELIKVLGGDKEKDRASGCEGRHADLCVSNARDTTLTVALSHRTTDETCELIILPAGKECCLQLAVGVWTYDLRLSGIENPMRKGDVLIEGCNHMTMTIK
jgi:hypothetical protein